MIRWRFTHPLPEAFCKTAQALFNPCRHKARISKSLLGLIIISGCFPSPVQALTYEDYPVVKLRSLDKITARTMTFEAKVGSTIRFGEIFIKVQACRKPPPVEKSEAAAFLQVWQSNESKQTSKWIFSGWMFASSPALSSMDHSVYDVWVLDCLGRDPEPIPQIEENAPGVKTPATDGEAPDAVPPSVEPDTVKPDEVTPDDDPGAFEDQAGQEGIQESVPASNMPQGATPEYAPMQDRPDIYEDETPADDSSPVDDTAPSPGMQQTPVPSQAVPAKQEFEGIY